MTEQNLDGQLIPIDQIRPDPAQPRKLLPPDLVEVLASGGAAFDILDQLRARAERDKWTRERLKELDALAHSIGEDGLMNPIRVIADSDELYRIEEGERRWWAHHILVQQGKECFQTIPAFVVEPTSVSSGLLRRRVAENVLRSNFTAIELGRAMASRIQEILDAEPGTKRSEAERCVGKENGMSDRRVRQFVALLKLSPEAQELAQQARLSENALRQIKGIKDEAGQLAAIRELMHPSRKNTTTRASARAEKHRKATPRLHGRAHSQGKHVPVSQKPPSRDKRTARRSKTKKTRQVTENGAFRSLKKILSLANSFKPTDWKRLRAVAWGRIMKGEADRHTLSKLRDVLERGLEISNPVNEGKAAADDRGHLGG